MKILRILPLILLLVSLISCEQESSSVREGGSAAFRTTPPDHLYFKNIRSSRYEQSTQPGTRIDLYKQRRFSSTTQRPILYPLIVDNWMEEEVYILIRPNEYQGGFTDTLRVFWESRTDSGSYSLASQAWIEQYRFAEQLRTSLISGHRLEVLTAGDKRVPLFEDKTDASLFLTTMRDFHELTE